MRKLHPSQYQAACRLYRSSVPFFPLIGAVLEGAQDGVVYANDPDAPSQFYVEHVFGFAQLFGAPDYEFEQSLAHYALADRAFESVKLRLYAPNVPSFLNTSAAAPLRSERQRFHLRSRADVRWDEPEVAVRQDIACVMAGRDNVELIEARFGVVHRFWRSAEDFVRGANCVLVTRQGEPAALCYAAAEADARAEIDVITLPEHRRLKLGRVAVLKFIERCFENAVDPLWDCFTNNEGSMMLAGSVGFSAMTAPYAFFTINKT